MGKKVIIPRTPTNHHHKTSKPLKPNKLDNSLIKQVVPPKVYIIDKSSFKFKVQQLTGHVSTPAPSPPPETSSPEIADHPTFFSDLYFHNQLSGVSEGTPSNSFSYSSMTDFVGYSLSDNSQTPLPEMAPGAFSDLYFDHHHQVCGISDQGTTTSNSYSSSMEDFGYSYSPESLSSSLDCTLKVDQKQQVYNNDLFSFDDLESWILDMGGAPEPEVSIYDYELSGLLS